MLSCLSNTEDAARHLRQKFDMSHDWANLSFDRGFDASRHQDVSVVSRPSDFQYLHVDQIAAFTEGPRLLRNPKWHEIKVAIKASGGLTDTLSVTKRPDDTHYVCRQGGNTRLLVLQELFRETSDPRFGQVQVEIAPFTGDFELALLHDRENTCRGDLNYIEEAWSKYRLYEMYCGTTRGKKTARAFVDRIRTEFGADITVEAFSRIKYTVEILYQHIPTCLVQGGMSQRAVRRLITIRKSLKKTWLDRSMGSTQHFDETFYGLLTRQDRDLATTFVRDDSAADQFPDQHITIDWVELQRDFQHEMSVYADVSYQKAGAWIAAAFRDIGKTNDDTSSPPKLPAKISGAPSRQALLPIEELRATAYSDAHEIAYAGGFGDLIEPSDGAFGYRITGEVPASASLEAKSCWWALVMATEPSSVVARLSGSPLGAPSFAGLSAEALKSISKLLAQHARIATQDC